MVGRLVPEPMESQSMSSTVGRHRFGRQFLLILVDGLLRGDRGGRSRFRGDATHHRVGLSLLGVGWDDDDGWDYHVHLQIIENANPGFYDCVQEGPMVMKKDSEYKNLFLFCIRRPGMRRKREGR